MSDAQGDPRSLDQCAVFGALDDASRIELLKHATRRHFKAGDVIFPYCSPGQSMMVVLSGEVRISLPERNGRGIILADLERGAILGEMAALDGKERSAEATALTSCDLLVIDRRDILAFLRQHPSACLDLLQLVCARLRGANERTLDIGFLDIPARLAKILLARARAHGLTKDGRLRIGDSQGDLAAMIGASRESANRALKQMQKNGILTMRDGWIVVLDQDSLQMMAELA